MTEGRGHVMGKSQRQIMWQQSRRRQTAYCKEAEKLQFHRASLVPSPGGSVEFSATL